MKVDDIFKPKRIKFMSYHTADRSFEFGELMGNHPDRDIYVRVEGGEGAVAKIDFDQPLELLIDVGGLTVTTSMGETPALLEVFHG